MKFTQEDLLKKLGIEVDKPFMCDGEKLFVSQNSYSDGTPSLFVCNEDGVYAELSYLLGKEITQAPKYTLTEPEKHIVLAIDEDFKWIARSSYGNLFVYASKPTKQGAVWLRNALGYSEFYPFNHHFQFIQWSDEEPVSLDELRSIAKGETK